MNIKDRNQELIEKLCWSSEKVESALSDLDRYLCGEPINLQGLIAHFTTRVLVPNAREFKTIDRLEDFPEAKELIIEIWNNLRDE